MDIESSEEVRCRVRECCGEGAYIVFCIRQLCRRPRRILSHGGTNFRLESLLPRVLSEREREERRERKRWTICVTHTSQLARTIAFRQRTRKPVMCLNLPTYLAPSISRSMEFIRSNCARSLARLGPPDRFGQRVPSHRGLPFSLFPFVPSFSFSHSLIFYRYFSGHRNDVVILVNSDQIRPGQWIRRIFETCLRTRGATFLWKYSKSRSPVMM